MTGYEPHEGRRQLAARVAAGLPNLTVQPGGWDALTGERYAAILLVDTLHHIPREAHRQVLQTLAAHLEPGGVLLISETDLAPSRRMQSWWNYLSDVLLYPGETRCMFRTSEELQEMLGEVKMRIDAVPLPSVFGFATILYVASRSNERSG